MFIILLISSITFFLRAVLEFLFVFDVIVLDFKYSLKLVLSSDTSHGNMHLIGSHLYVSFLLDSILKRRTMYFFFFYFLTEICPLSILLISTYIRPQAKPAAVQQTPTPTPYSTLPSPGSNQSQTSIKSLLRRVKNKSGEAYQSVCFELDSKS